MQQYFALLFVCGLVILGVGLLSGRLRNQWAVSGPIGALATGALAGPHALALVDLGAFSDPEPLTREVTRLTLAMALMATALRLPQRVGPLFRATGLVLLLIMPAMWIAGSLIAWAALDVPVLTALLIGAIVSPTDPVLASGVLAGDLAQRSVPNRLRHLLSAEAAANDGLAMLFVMLPVLLIGNGAQQALAEWGIRVLVWEVGIGMLVGALCGHLVGRVLQPAMERRISAPVSLFTISVALAISVLGVLRLLHADGILGVFVAGLFFCRITHPQIRQRTEHVQETARTLLELPAFVLLGILLPFDRWIELGGEGLLFCLGVLFLRRVPAVLVLGPLTGFFRNWRETAFFGWFGPMGIAAVFYALFAFEHTGIGEIWPVVSMLVTLSIIAHGMTATPCTARLAAAYAEGRIPRRGAESGGESKA